MGQFQRVANALFIYILCGVLIGAYIYEFLEHSTPCPLCLLQRLGIAGTALALLFNLRFGLKAEHYGLGLVSSILGCSVSLRQTSYHICQLSSTGVPILGYNLYIWSFIVYVCSIVAIALLLMIFGWTEHRTHAPSWKGIEKLALGFVTLLLLTNIVTVLAHV